MQVRTLPLAPLLALLAPPAAAQGVLVHWPAQTPGPGQVAVPPAGDLDGDGVAELVVAAPQSVAGTTRLL